MEKIITTFLLLYLSVSACGQDWPQFRGPLGNGHAQSNGLPTKWDRNTGVVWKIILDGKAWSSPICVDEQILLTNALENEGRLTLEVISVGFNSGQIQWRKKLFEYGTQPRIHRKNSYASPTPFYDQKNIYVHFGNLGTACLNLCGEVIWKSKLDYEPVHGSGASPVIYDDLLLISADGKENPCLYALNKKTGQIKWSTPRESEAQKKFSFCTPIIVETEGAVQIVSPASDFVFGYDLNGNQIWKFNYPNGYSVVPRPIFHQGLIYMSSGYDSPVFYAIKLEGRGDITKSNLVWRTRKGAPRNSSPVLVNDLLFMAADHGVVSCLNAKTGQLIWMERVAGSCSPSMLYSNGKIFLTDETGKTFIFDADKKFNLIATNDLEEQTLASPVVCNDSILIRTEMGLWRIDSPH